jgi:two-component system nitrate/nitrite response regulator NarL
LFLRGIVQEVKERPDLELVGQATNGRQALADLKSLQPDVAVIDMRIPGLSGLELVAAAKRDAIKTRIVVLSAHVESDLVYRAIAAGAAGYLSKGADRDAILDAVAAVARGEVVLAPEVHAGLAGEIRRREVVERPILTPREKEVLVLTADGLTAPEIADRLQLGVATVRSHLQNLYEKLGVSDRAAAVAAAMRAGLLE